MGTERQLHEDSRSVEKDTKRERLAHILGNPPSLSLSLSACTSRPIYLYQTHNANYTEYLAPDTSISRRAYIPTYVHHHPTPRFSLVVFAPSLVWIAPSVPLTLTHLYVAHDPDIPAAASSWAAILKLAWRNPAQPHAKVNQSQPVHELSTPPVGLVLPSLPQGTSYLPAASLPCSDPRPQPFLEGSGVLPHESSKRAVKPRANPQVQVQCGI